VYHIIYFLEKRRLWNSLIFLRTAPVIAVIAEHGICPLAVQVLALHLP